MGQTWGLRPPQGRWGSLRGEESLLVFLGSGQPGRPAPSGTVWAAAQTLGSREQRGPLASALPHSDRPAAQRHELDPLSRQKAGGSGISLGDAVMTGVY